MISFKLPLEEAQKYSIGQIIPVEVNGMKTSRMITSMRVVHDNIVRITATSREPKPLEFEDFGGFYEFTLEDGRNVRVTSKWLRGCLNNALTPDPQEDVYA
ncbi:hypothetical protein [Lacunimicrobium album]